MLLTRRPLLLLLLIPLLFLLPACGGKDSIVVPENPFDGVSYGTDATLEIVTWNVENFAKKDDTTVDYLVQAIEAMDVDIIALQEIQDSVLFRELHTQLQGWTGFKASSAYDDLDLAYIYREGGPLADVTIREILTDEYSLPRAPLVLECTFNGVPLVVINNHYKCCGDNVIDENRYNDEEKRRRDASLILQDYCEAVFADDKVIILGDMNDVLTDAPSANVFQNFLGSEDWLFVDLQIAEDPTAQWSFPGWPSHIDHILVNEHMLDDATAAGAETRVLPLHTYLGSLSRYDANISDHLPVMFRCVPTPAGSGGGQANPFAGAVLGDETSFEVVTWNLEHFPKADAATVQTVELAIEAMQPDLVALQEIESASQFNTLVARLDGWSGIRAGSTYNSSNLAYLYRTATVTVSGSYDILADEQALTRPAHVLECSFGGQSLVVINNHFKCCGDGNLDDTDEWDEEWRRLRASRLMIEYVAANHPGDRVILLGDLNDELDDPSADNVFVDFLDDGANWRFTDLSIALDGGALWSYPSWPSHLDHIAVTNELFSAVEAASADCWVVPLHQYVSGGWSSFDGMVSDHLPVALRITP